MNITAVSCSTASLQSQIYNFFANCLEIFKNKVTLLMKISRDRSANQTYDNQLAILQEKSYELYQVFMALQQDIIKKHQQVCLRFFSRVKEIVHTYSLQIQHSSSLADDIKKLEEEIKQIDKNNLKVKEIVWFLMMKIPSSQSEANILKREISQQSDFRKTLNNFNVTILSQEQTSKQSKLAKNNALKQSYEKCLQKLNKDLSLFDCLCLDEAEYRRTFFLSQRNQTHQDNQLYEQITQRNKYIKWIMQMYSDMFSKYIVKKSSPKKKVVKREETSLDSKQNSKNKFIKEKEKRENEKNNLKKEKEEKLRLKQLKQRTNTIWYRQNQKIVNHKNMTEMLETPPCEYEEDDKKFDREQDGIVSLSSKYKTATQMSMAIHHKDQSQLNIVSIFPLKKIEFKDNKLELGPEKMLNMNAQIKKRDLFQRTQQKFRNKMSNSKSRQTSKRVLEESIDSSANFLVNKKPNNRIKTQCAYNSKTESSHCPFYTPLNIVYSESTAKYYPAKIAQKNPHRLIEQLRSHQHIPNKTPEPQNQLNGKVFEITSVHSVDKYNLTGTKYKPINSRKINSKRVESNTFNSKLLNIGVPKNQY